ncbi:MAG: hypothetical protein IID30_11275 [Planctomycetes bacterium]|nr:hypothetical protein [Planctomycetota bacterium]
MIVLLLSLPGNAFAQCDVIRLKPLVQLPGDAFGTSVDIQDDRIIVGASSWWADDARTGYADIFRKIKGAWRHEARLSSPSGHPGNAFGRSVLLVKDLAIITAPLDFDGRVNVFALYVFKRRGHEWRLRERLLFPGFYASTSLASDGRRLVVGFLLHTGGTYVYRLQGKKLVFKQELTPTDHPTGFGATAVAIEGDRIIVGHASDRTNDDNHIGSAYIYRFDPTMNLYVQEAKLLPTGLYGTWGFGDAVGIAGDVAMVQREGLVQRDIHIFQAVGNEWSLKQILIAPNLKGFSTALVINNSRALLASFHCEPSDQVNVECIPGISYTYQRNPETDDWHHDYPLRIDEQFPEINIFSFKVRSIDMEGDVAVLGAPETNHPVQGAGAAFVFTGLNSLDENFNDRPDACDIPGDASGDGLVNVSDLLILLGTWGPCNNCPADFDADGNVGVLDLITLLGNWN